MNTKILLSTIDDREKANRLAHRLVSENLAACVSIIPDVSSVYKWKGEVETAAECLLVIKTAEDRLEELISRLAEIHPYEVPEAVALAIEKGHPPYLQWLFSETRPVTG